MPRPFWFGCPTGPRETLREPHSNAPALGQEMTALERARRRARRLRGAGLELAADFFVDLAEDPEDMAGFFDAVVYAI